MDKEPILTIGGIGQFNSNDKVVLASDVKELLKAIAHRSILYYGDGVAEGEMVSMCLTAARELTDYGVSDSDVINGKRYLNLMGRL